MSWASYANLRSHGVKNIPILDNTKIGIYMKPTPLGIVGKSALEGKKVLDNILDEENDDSTNALKLKNRTLTKEPLTELPNPEKIAYHKSGSASRKNVY